MAMFKDTNKIMALLNSNKSIYVNTGSERENQKNKEHFQMRLLNASHFQVSVITKDGLAYVEGFYVVRYYLDGKTPPEDPEPLVFSIAGK